MRLLTTAIAAGVAAQFLLAGAGAFGATSFHAHEALGWSIGIAALVALAIAVVRRRSRIPTALLAGVVAVQLVLGVLGTETTAWFGALHGLNALAVMATAGNLARRTAMETRR